MDPISPRKGAANVARVVTKPATEAALSPKTTLVLDVTAAGGKKYEGKFQFRVPSMGDRIDIAALRSRYLQELEHVDSTGTNIADALAYLSITIDNASAPAWWRDSNNGIDLYHYEPLFKLYALGRAYESTFLGYTVDDPATDGSDADGLHADVDGNVDGDVQPTVERSEILAEFTARSS